jgi:hypothetical protein
MSLHIVSFPGGIDLLSVVPFGFQDKGEPPFRFSIFVNLLRVGNYRVSPCSNSSITGKRKRILTHLRKIKNSFA